MRDKKSKSAQLERKRFIFLEIGAIITLAAVLLAFNYRTYPGDAFLDFDRTPSEFPDDFVIVTVQPPQQPPAPPTPAPFFKIRDNDVDIETDYQIDVEADQQTVVDAWVPYVPDEVPEPEPEPYVFVGQEPAFPGGERARQQFLLDNVKYPMTAREAGISGTVYIQFVVETDGSISNVEVLRGPDGGLNEEAVRVTYVMPNWNPGRQQGKAVRVFVKMPIKFVLQ